jgi:hypothetical protein
MPCEIAARNVKKKKRVDATHTLKGTMCVASTRIFITDLFTRNNPVIVNQRLPR